MSFFDRATENRINKFRVIDAVLDFESVMIHLRATVRANHFRFRHLAASLVLMGQLIQAFLKVTSPTLRQSLSCDRSAQQIDVALVAAI